MITRALKNRLNVLRDREVIKVKFNTAGPGLLRLIVEQKFEWWVFGEDTATHTTVMEKLTAYNNTNNRPVGEFTIFIRADRVYLYAAKALLLKIFSEHDIEVISIENR